MMITYSLRQALSEQIEACDLSTYPPNEIPIEIIGDLGCRFFNSVIASSISNVCVAQKDLAVCNIKVSVKVASSIKYQQCLLV